MCVIECVSMSAHVWVGVHVEANQVTSLIVLHPIYWDKIFYLNQSLVIQPVQPVSLSQDSLSVLPGDEIYRQAARLLGVYMGAVDPDSSHLHNRCFAHWPTSQTQLCLLDLMP